MTRVTPLAPPLPDMTVIELSVIVALLTSGPLNRDRIRQVVGDWFVRSTRTFDLEPCLARLRARSWLFEDPVKALSPTRAGEEPTLLLYAGVIRMIGAIEGDGRNAGSLRLNGFGKGEET